MQASDSKQASVPVITIDGPSGTGKGTIAQIIASRLGWHLLDSGALYRLLGYAAKLHTIDFKDINTLSRLAEHLDVRFQADEQGNAQIMLEGEDVSDVIRTEEVGSLASQVATIAQVRTALLARQYAFREPPGLVADGRDMGTVVFPDANLKIFLTASADERARRRHKQLKEKGINAKLDDLSRDILARDERDASRAVAPLKPANDAQQVDTSDMSIEQVVECIDQLLQQKGLLG